MQPPPRTESDGEFRVGTADVVRRERRQVGRGSRRNRRCTVTALTAANARIGALAMLSGGGMPEYLFSRTDGVLGVLKKIVQEGCRHAIETGAEKITAELLDTITISPADLTGLDPGSGEVPDIPRAPARPSRKRRKLRNTVFDDRGTPADGTAG